MHALPPSDLVRDRDLRYGREHACSVRRLMTIKVLFAKLSDKQLPRRT